MQMTMMMMMMMVMAMAMQYVHSLQYFQSRPEKGISDPTSTPIISLFIHPQNDTFYMYATHREATHVYGLSIRLVCR